MPRRKRQPARIHVTCNGCPSPEALHDFVISVARLAPVAPAPVRGEKVNLK